MKIHFPQQSKTIEITEKVRLSSVIREHFGDVLNMSCGGKGTCGKCVVRLGDGRTVLACETILNDGAGGDDKTDAEQEMTVFLNLLDAESRWEILNGVLPGVLKKVELEEDSDAASDGLCFAFDIGTTTLAGCLLKGKSVIASTSRPNPQRCFGADVISRIEYGISGCSDLSGSSERSENKKIRELQHVLLQAIHEMMGEMLGRGGLAFSDVKCVVFAGNTTMEETLLGLSLESLATSPFLPSEGLGTVFSAGDSVWNGEFSDLPSEAEVRIFPVIGGFVGGDITAGILAVADDLGNNSENSSENDSENDSENTDGASFLLDLGTNGEMVLETVNGKTGKTERIACATAAGPCFEGAKISCGMCAETGAVTCIENRDGAFFCVTVQNAPIRGICGSALIDLTAELLRLGILTVDGRLLEPEEVVEALSAESEQKIPSEWATRVVKVAVSVENSTREDFSVGFQLAPGITVTQEDFRELQLAVGAIRTGIRILFRRGEVTVDDVAHFRIAGGFGRGIRMRNAQKIGLIPAEISEKKLEFVGNSSLSGAVLAAVSERFWTLARTVADTTRCLDLALDRDFSDVFMESMFWEEF